nr:hypothetical protein [uncultured Vibrio sp.]
MITEISKDLVGKVIYGIPTGNNRRRQGQSKIEKFDVLSVGRVYMTLNKVGASECYADKYNIRGATQRAANSGYGTNAGYMFFDSLANLELHQKANEARHFLRETFSIYGKQLPDAAVIRISEVVKEYTDD